MASSRAQASQGIEKRKRDKADPDASSYKKRRQAKVEKEAVAGATPRKGNADGAIDEVTTSQGGVESRSKGDIFRENNLQSWRISEPMGGRMSDVDPIFSVDEK